jgi:hypothetical protein
MKSINLLFAIATVIPQFSQATHQNCDSATRKDYQHILDLGQIELNSFDRVTNGHAIDQIRDSSHPTAAEKRNAIAALSGRKNIAYLAYSDFMGGTGIEIIIANRTSCKIETQIMTYVE